MKSIHLSWIDGRDAHYPTDEPNPAHVEYRGWTPHWKSK